MLSVFGVRDLFDRGSVVSDLPWVIFATETQCQCTPHCLHIRGNSWDVGIAGDVGGAMPLLRILFNGLHQMW